MAASETNGKPQFPCETMPAVPAQARLLGLYDQRQEGLLMQRIKILAGRLEIRQWRRIAELALEYTPGYPLHFTTRQDIELHGLTAEQVPGLQRELAKAGLTTVGACGDTIRAVTVGPECGMVQGSWDLGPLAHVIHQHVQSLPGAFQLPRKFKISLSGCPDGCARPYINDIGLVANSDGTFEAILAGSLGPKPGAGISCYERLSLSEVLPLVTAAFRLFEAEGDRQNRSRARLRHIRERLGNEVFLQRLNDLLEEEKQKPYLSLPSPERHDGADRPFVWLNVPNGDLSPEDALSLADLLEKQKGALRIGLEHDLHAFGILQSDLPESLRRLIRGASVIACPGAHLCHRGLVETWDVANDLRQILPKGSGLLVGFSGCPNNCAEGPVADIGLVGRLKTVDGASRMHVRLFAGGGRGQTPELAVELHPAVPLEQVAGVVRGLVDQWQSASLQTAVSFGDFVRQNTERLIAEIGRMLPAA